MYAGMVIGENAKEGDMEINPVKQKVSSFVAFMTKILACDKCANS